MDPKFAESFITYNEASRSLEILANSSEEEVGTITFKIELEAHDEDGSVRSAKKSFTLEISAIEEETELDTDFVFDFDWD